MTKADAMHKKKRRKARKDPLAQALSHPTRVRILMALNSPRRRVSPAEFHQETGLTLNHVSYHFRALEKAGCIEEVASKPRRGAVEHYFEAVESAMAWQKEWESLGSYVKQTLAASALRGGVEAAGKSIDAGKFHERDESHLSHKTFRVDHQAWAKMAKIMDRTLAEFLEVEKEVEDRASAESPTFMATFFMSLFEAAPGQRVA